MAFFIVIIDQDTYMREVEKKRKEQYGDFLKQQVSTFFIRKFLQ